MTEPKGDESLAKADIQLFESGDFADATIVCGDRTWKVHKLILGTRCKWFKAAFYGSMVEATSSKVVLQEQDADIVDAVLRFIYAKDIDISGLSDRKHVPVLCVQLFRAADFFQLQELKAKAMKELELSLANALRFLDSERDMVDISESDSSEDAANEDVIAQVESPVWHLKILDAVEDAYKDGSTAPVLELLLDFIYKNTHKIFRFSAAVSLLDKLPNMGKDLMKTHINGIIIAQQNETPKFRLGLPVRAAIQSPDHFFKAGSVSWGRDGAAKCRLYPIENGGDSIFMPVNPETGTELADLRWITPCPTTVTVMMSHPDSEFVRLKIGSRHEAQELFIRFDAYGDARLYVELYQRRYNIKYATAKDVSSLAAMIPTPVSQSR